MAKQITAPEPKGLNDAQVVLTNLMASGKTQTEIAKMFKSSQATVSKIYSGVQTSGYLYDTVLKYWELQQKLNDAPKSFEQDEKRMGRIVLILLVACTIVLSIMFIDAFNLI